MTKSRNRKINCGDIEADGVMNVYEAADINIADGQELSGTIHLPSAAAWVGEEQ